LAGDCRITIRATAPRAYPGEEVEIVQTIHVLPYYHHRLELFPPDKPVEITQTDEALLPKDKTGLPPQQKLPATPVPPAPAAVTAGLAGAAVPSQTGSKESPTQSPPSPETTTVDWWETPAETTSTPDTPAIPDTAPTEQTADWWTAPTESEPHPRPEPESSTDTIPTDWWTMPATPEPISESVPAEIPEQQVEERRSTQGEENVIDLPVEPETATETTEIEMEMVETSPASAMDRQETSSKATPDVVSVTDKATVDDGEPAQTGPEPDLEEPWEPAARLAAEPAPEPEDWWFDDTPTRQEPPLPTKETPQVETQTDQFPPTAAPDWWFTGPPAEEADKSTGQTETTGKAAGAMDKPVDKTTTETPASDDVPDWWHTESSDTEDENNS
jgi:hypothetical protein